MTGVFHLPYQQTILRTLFGFLFSVTIASFPAISHADTIRIGGSGAGLGALRHLGDSFTAQNPEIRVNVLPSLGTPGGLRALIAADIDIALALRELTAAEKAQGITETVCVATAMIYVTSRPAPTALTRAQLPGIYANPAPSWPDGQPLKIILRSRAGSENAYLATLIPGMAPAMDAAYRRPGMPVGATDQENADLALRTAGSLAVTTLLQVRAEHLALTILPIDGFAPSAASIADKTYPFPLRLCLVVRANAAPATTAFLSHITSTAGQALLRTMDANVIE